MSDDTLGTYVRVAGYGYHDRPYYSVKREGFTTYLLRLQVEGQAETVIDGRRVPLGVGDLLLLAPKQPYELRIGDPSAYQTPVRSADYYIFCDGPWLDAWWRNRCRPRLATIPLDDAMLSLWRQVAWEKRRIGRTDERISDYLLRVLCLFIDRSLDEWQTRVVSPESLAAHRMKRFIEQNIGDELTLQDVADEVGLSVSRAVHLFKETFGCTIVQYIVDVRLKLASDRIRFSAMTLEQAAESAGFRSYSYFYRVFRDRYGVSPKQYRQQMQ
ncbi:helix-turn-helix transcriptional regulator [Alicyclobacillus shizuokensis]|uniref:helix-turn-helix transcriptional regulator n=1 Tax=Alicyclobacillus shizuokensis TaxID=392014 RepID=UPI00083439FB|nr:AraC family transcriptional regulator [Alicyclobacillus shizuokensis]MCL6627610.1 AraC family transcriptional regulator [Alicyclobacillus shizuokensis]